MAGDRLTADRGVPLEILEHLATDAPQGTEWGPDFVEGAPGDLEIDGLRGLRRDGERPSLAILEWVQGIVPNLASFSVAGAQHRVMGIPIAQMPDGRLAVGGSVGINGFAQGPQSEKLWQRQRGQDQQRPHRGRPSMFGPVDRVCFGAFSASRSKAEAENPRNQRGQRDEPHAVEDDAECSQWRDRGVGHRVSPGDAQGSRKHPGEPSGQGV